MQAPTPDKQHEWLARLVGEWTWESAADGTTYSGTESVRSIGGVWVICEGVVGVPGGDFATNVMTLGFDQAKQRFVGSFIGSMMTNLWVYDGALAGEDRLELFADGPSFTGEGGLATYRDAIEFHGPNERTLTSHVLAADGSWQEFMTARYRRVQLA